MGAHHSSTTGPTITAAEGVDDVLPPMDQHPLLSQFKVQHRLVPGSGRMMKTWLLHHNSNLGAIVVKATWIDFSSTSLSSDNNNTTTTKSIHQQLQDHQAELQRIKTALRQEPHVAPFSHWIHQTDFYLPTNLLRQKQPVYLLRPHLYTTLSDKLASRPFLSQIEKVWMVQQLLSAIDKMHAAKVCHGFLTTENVGLTSWNWLVITDIASYKAHTALPDDDPSEYLFYFQDHHHATYSSRDDSNNPMDSNKKISRSNREKRCYLAPERFVSTSTTTNADKTTTMLLGSNDETYFSPHNRLTPAMDIFSAGCVVMELWLNGDRALDLGDLMEYRANSGGNLTATLQQKLSKIESSALRAGCKHMLQLDPSQRLSAQAYLERLQAADAVPMVMPHHLEPLLREVSDPHNSAILTPDARLTHAANHYATIVWETLGIRDEAGTAYLQRVLGKTMVELEHGSNTTADNNNDKEEKTIPTQQPHPKEQAPGQASTSELLAETDALLKKLESLSFLNNTEDTTMTTTASAESSAETTNDTQTSTADATGTSQKPETAERSALCKSSILIYIQLVLASIRHVQRPTSKLVALQMLTRLCDLCDDDEIRLQRMVPVSVSLLQDQDALVRASALQFLTHVVSHVQSFPPSDSKLFPQYIFKRVSPLLTDSSLVVRLAFCQSIAVLAETAQRFLDISHAVRIYEAIGSGGGGGASNGGGGLSTANSSSGSLAPTDDDAKKTKSTKSKKTSAPTSPTVFGDDVAKLLGDDTATKTDTDKVDGESKDALEESSNTASSANNNPGVNQTLIISNYREELSALQETVSRWVVHITTDPSEHSSPTKRALLDSNLSRLCTFFGLEGVMAFMLPQILAFLNDRKDAQLRAALFVHLPAVCRIVGRAATEHFILPCLESGLVDGEEQVVGAAVRCLAELIDLGLISRSVLLGNITVESTSESTTDLKSDGFLRKYGSLLVHPSAEIRHGAIATVNAACSALGSPDSEVYVAHLLHPFLRFQPSMRHLQTQDGMESCLYPSWSRDKFDKELSDVVNAAQQQPVGPWTAIGMTASDVNPNSMAAVPGTNVATAPSVAKPKRSTAEVVEEAQIGRVREYLRLLGRRIRQPILTPKEESADGTAGGHNVLKNGIEGSLKLAQNIKFPRQDAIGPSQRTLPLWYSTLRDRLQATNSTISETSAIRSVSALGQIYGLSIMAASDGTTEQVLTGGGDETKLSEKEMQDLAESKESQVIEAVSAGEWGSETQLDPVLLDTSLLITKLKALNVPPLPPRLGDLTNSIARTAQTTPAPAPRTPGKDTGGSAEWRPKADTLIATSSTVAGHSAPVARIAVSLDQSFFVSGSYDGTCRVWEMDQIETSSGILDSSVTYSGHAEGQHGQNAIRINDVAMVEGSHSVVSGASNGTVHVWRVDVVSQTQSQPHSDLRANRSRSRVVGASEVRQIDPAEGEILAVSHFNSPSASIVTFASQKGTVHSWDLRSCVEPFSLKHGPDIGYLTSMALGTDRNWILTGTSRGFLALWDLRFNQTVKLWHHSRAAPITRLATSSVPPPQLWNSRNLDASSVKPYVFASCGPNECAMFDITTGSCSQCFRTVGYGSHHHHPAHGYGEDIPMLEEVPISTASSTRRALMTNGFLNKNQYANMTSSPMTAINAMCGSIGVSNNSYLLTGGGDARIRFWDFAVPSKCFVVSGQSSMQPRPSYERIDVDSRCRLMMCRQMPSARKGAESSSITMKSKLGKGLAKPENHHTEAIQDLKIVNKALISASRDCTIKVWR